MHACIKKYGTKVTHDFLISALDDAILFLRVSGCKGMLDLRQACKLCEELVAKGGTLVSVNDVGNPESTEVLKDAPVVFVGNSSTQRENASIITWIWVSLCSPCHPVGEDRCGLCVDSQKDCKMRM